MITYDYKKVIIYFTTCCEECSDFNAWIYFELFDWINKVDIDFTYYLLVITENVVFKHPLPWSWMDLQDL